MKTIYTLLFITLVLAGYSQTTVYIPTVFHVVYNGAAENIPDATLLQQLQSWNADFSDTTCPNTYAKDADTHIQFCLASTDPSGSPTNGITRTSTTVAAFSTDNKVKFGAQGGHDVWDASRYFNVWICDMGASLLGYGQAPGGNASTDGVVAHYKYLVGGAAPFNFGRQATHEIARWLGVPPISTTTCTVDGDGISDTPIQMPSSGCAATGTDACCGLMNADLNKNFMANGYDACMCFFTPGQVAKMWSTLSGPRSSLLTSNGCMLTGIHENVLNDKISVFPNPSSGKFVMNIDFTFENVSVIIYNSFGQEIRSIIIQDRKADIDLSDRPAGVYYARVNANGVSVVKQLTVLK